MSAEDGPREAPREPADERRAKASGQVSDGAGQADGADRADKTGMPRAADATATESLDALCVHAGETPTGLATPPVAPPLYAASAFHTPRLADLEAALSGEDEQRFLYARLGHPNARAFADAVAALEGAEAGVAAASGMAAIAAALRATLTRGDRVVTTGALYGNTHKLLDLLAEERGVRVEHRAPADEGPLPADTRLLFTEAIANPSLLVPDLPSLAERARDVGAALYVDATFATPILCRPLHLGADLVLHSATKYLGGHGDLMLGVAAGRKETIEGLRAGLALQGAQASPFAAWLALRGLRTLHLRMPRHAANARAAAAWLAARPEVARVWHPSLPDHPSHAVARRLLPAGEGGIVTFTLPGGLPDVERFLSGLRRIRLVASLADVSSTVSVPVTSSHRDLAPERRAEMGIEDGTIRLSCGLEAAEDIVADLARGLAALG